MAGSDVRRPVAHSRGPLGRCGAGALLSQSHPLRDRQQLRTLLVFAGTWPDSTWHQVTQSRLSWHHLLRLEGAHSLGEGNRWAQGHTGSGTPTGQGLPSPPTASFCGGAGGSCRLLSPGLGVSAGKSQQGSHSVPAGGDSGALCDPSPRHVALGAGPDTQPLKSANLLGPQGARPHLSLSFLSS